MYPPVWRCILFVLVPLTARPAPMIRRLLLGLGLLVGAAPGSVWGQTDGLLQLDDETHRFLQVQKTKGHLPDAFLSHQPLSVYEARRYLDTLAVRDSAEQLLSADSRARLARLRGKAPRPGAEWAQRTLSLYENGHDLLAWSGSRYGLQINPLYDGHLGPAIHEEESDRVANGMAWRNTRGLRLSGHVGKYLFFESRISENQWKPAWDEFANNTAPRVSHISFHDPGTAYDFFDAIGVIGVHTRHVEVRVGRDHNHWGRGQGSLILSDYPTAYDQAQVRATLGPVQYTYLLARFLNATPQQNTRPFRPSRYAALHRFVIQATDALELSFFEGVVLKRDTLGVQRSRTGFDPAYLNPVTLFRGIERDLGSPDNALLGVGAAWRPVPGTRLYGQFLLDELRVSRIGDEWWGNKWGGLLGLHLTRTGVPNLSARVEASRIRPYVYSHRTGATAFTHMDDGVGHPAGPNSIDVSLFLDYEPPGPWRAFLNAAWTVRGRNGTNEAGEVTENYGADPRVSFQSRVDGYGITMLQGIRQQQGLLETAVAYEVLPHLRVMAAVRGERVVDAERGTDYYLSPRLVLSWGFPYQSLRY
jgi:hypothetical protein